MHDVLSSASPKRNNGKMSVSINRRHRKNNLPPPPPLPPVHLVLKRAVGAKQYEENLTVIPLGGAHSY